MASVVVGVTGGVAAFKAPIVVRECQRAGHDVRVAATLSSLDFVGRSTSTSRGRGALSTWSSLASRT